MNDKTKLVPASRSFGQLSLIDELGDTEDDIGTKPSSDCTVVHGSWTRQFDQESEKQNENGGGRRRRVTVLNYGSAREEFSVGLFGVLSKPLMSLSSFFCPCLGELYVGWKFNRRVIACLMFGVTLLMISVYCVFWVFERDLWRETRLEEFYSENGVQIDQRNLKYLKTWSLVLYLMVLLSIGVRFLLYIVMRMQIRGILRHKSNKNPDLCHSPDYCAVFWCTSCVLCQHVIEANSYNKNQELMEYQPV